MNINQLVNRAVMVGLLAAVVGCASYPAGVVGQPAPNSKFAKLKVGMSQNQVESLIGKSKDCVMKTDAFSLPKMFTSTDMATVCAYKGEGTLVFDFNSALYTISVDRSQNEFLNGSSPAPNSCNALLKAAGKCK